MRIALATIASTLALIAAGMIAPSTAPAASPGFAQLPPAPATPAELHARLARLRDHYAPYLRSLPPPLAVRSQRDLSGTWRSTFEVEDFRGGTRPTPPAWHRVDLDDSDWEKTTVPEWRYDKSEPFGTKPNPEDYRPDSRILWYRTIFAGTRPQADQRVFLVFAGVAWEAEVWLNGTRLGRHAAYWEPFRFDVTSLLKEKNVLAVRVLAGPKLGEPVCGWTLFPIAHAVQPRYVRDASRSVIGQRELFGFKGNCLDSGIGIHREVLLEITGRAIVSDLFVRNDLSAGAANIRIETDSALDKELAFDVQILPENFAGQSYGRTATVQVRRGAGQQTMTVPMPGARPWQPQEPCLYRCRVTIRAGDKTIDSKDVLFGCRSFRLLTAKDKRPDLPEGTFLLNGQPLYLRGAGITSALNIFWYWHQDDKLLSTVLMMKAANFNALRANDNIQFPEVRELLDRLGMLSEQEMVGAGRPVPMDTIAELCARLARQCYNNSGVILLTSGLETHFDPTQIIAAILAVDPQRIVKPISGNMKDWSYGLPPGYPSLPKEYWDHVVDDFHTYAGWYRRGIHLAELAKLYHPGRLVTAGEFGAEALDSYAAMKRYPAHLQPPPLDGPALWGNCQVKRGDPKMTVGLRGREPATLGEMIEASQTYQADALAEQATGFRISPQRIAGYFVFHFMDGLPAQWPKSIVSFDGTPKKAYFALTAVNQPLTPLCRISDEGKTIELWVANDGAEALPRGRVAWRVEAPGKRLMQGEERADVKPFAAAAVAKIVLSPVVQKQPVITVALALKDAAGEPVSQYGREVFLQAWQPVPHKQPGPPSTARIPKLPDGAAGDPAKVNWTKVPPLAAWRKTLDRGPTKHAIESRLAHDGRFLYIKLAEPVAPDDLRADSGVWTGDNWLLYFAREPKQPFRQIGVNPKGTAVERSFPANNTTPLRGAKMVSTVAQGCWTVLLGLPLDTLAPGGLKPDGVFYGNFERHVAAGDEYPDYISWSPSYRDGWAADFPDRFGELRLE